MTKYTRARYPQPTPRRSLMDMITNIVALAMVVIVGWLAWPMLLHEFQTRTGMAPPTAPALTQPTMPAAPLARPQPAPASAPVSAPAQAVPTASLAQIEATSLAIYQATASAAELHTMPVPNTDITGDAAPIVLDQQSAEERHAAGDNVPTAEPVQQAESSGMFGSKPVLVNPQETHECKHGQVWVGEQGCRNPTPIGGN